jgi:hypothetical protein
MTHNEPHARRSHRVQSVASVVILSSVVLAPLVGGCWLYRGLDAEADRRALTHTTWMIVRYLIRTEGAWPASWDDLEPDFAPTNNSYRTPDRGVLEQRVIIDFSWDPQSAMDETSDRPGPLRLVNGRKSRTLDEGNQRIIEILRARRRTEDVP